jgi:uncharacterized membrane protein YcaP (DUF421 family)
MEIVLRVTCLYLFVLAGLRVIGKRELSQLSPAELVILMLIPEMATDALNQGDYSITNALVGISTLLCLVFFTSLFSYRFPLVEKLISGEPALVAKDGKFNPDILDRERLPAQEVLAELHKAGFEKLDQMKWVILETDGKITFVPFRHDAATDVNQGAADPQNKL